MTGAQNDRAAMRQFSARLFFGEGADLFRRGLVPVIGVSLLSALLQGIVGGMLPADMPDAPGGDFSLAHVLALLIRAFEACAVYAVLTSRHPGAQWSLRDLHADTASRVCLMILALFALVLALIPALGAFALPMLLILLALGSIAPVPMLCERLPALVAFRQIVRLAMPVMGPFFGYSTLVVAIEQLLAWGGLMLFGETLADLPLTMTVALVNALAGALSAAIFVAMYFRLRGPRGEA